MMFSNDGTRLAVGGGTWYGAGGLVIADLGTGAFRCTAAADLFAIPEEEAAPSIVGVYFSADDRFLAVATRGPSFGPGSSDLLAVEAIEARHHSTIARRSEDPVLRPCASAVQLAGGSMITRRRLVSLADCIRVHALPPRLGCRADERRQHLTHSRMVVRRGRVLTGSESSGRDPVGLVSAPLMYEGAVEVIPVQACAFVTAIAALPGEDGFLTGGIEGVHDRWSGGDVPTQTRLVLPADERRASASLLESTIPPTSPRSPSTLAPVIAICTLSDGERWVSVDSVGRLRLWRGDAMLSAWTLPTPGWPRCLAAHPTEPWIAVGLKQGNFADPFSVVLVLEC